MPPVEEAKENTIYMVKDEGVLSGDTYKEFLLIDGALTQIGDTSVDLTNYEQKPASFVEGNLVGFAADGSLYDTGIAAQGIGTLVLWF